MQKTTLCIPIRKNDDLLTHVCLAMKKRGFGEGMWNGFGGKMEESESIEEAMIREAHEEAGIQVLSYKKIGEIEFRFPKKKEWDQYMYVYLADKWEGEPQESEEMKPDWFHIDDIPYDNMWPSDAFWMPEVFKEKRIKAQVVHEDVGVMSDKQIEIVDSF